MGLLGRDGVRRSVILQCGQPLCDMFSTQTNYLPASKKFKFSEKLSQMQQELGKLLSHQTYGKFCLIYFWKIQFFIRFSKQKNLDVNRLATLSTDLVNLLR